MIQHKYKDRVFTLKEDRLGVLKNINEFLELREDIIFEIDKKVDSSVILKYERLISDKRRAVEEVTDKAKKAKLQKELDDLIQRYETDSEVAAINKTKKARLDNKMSVLIADAELMKRTIPFILNEDCEGIEFGGATGFVFCLTIFADFFFGKT